MLRILGVSAYYHDSAACLVEDGRIVAAAQEERFTRKKHDASFPAHAIDYCLRQAGIGAESIRFYQNFYTCGYFSGCTNYTTSTHFMGHFGAGIRFYPFGNFFIRPEAHVYLIRNNIEFSSNYAVRYGASIGYTFGGR